MLDDYLSILLYLGYEKWCKLLWMDNDVAMILPDTISFIISNHLSIIESKQKFSKSSREHSDPLTPTYICRSLQYNVSSDY